MDLLFHYTSEETARSIIADAEDGPGAYVNVSSGNWFGDGFYATPILPADRGTIDEVNSACFAGTRTAPELACALVLRQRNAQYQFEPCPNPDHWLIPESPMGIIWLDTLLVEVRRLGGDAWSVIWVNPDL